MRCWVDGSCCGYGCVCDRVLTGVVLLNGGVCAIGVEAEKSGTGRGESVGAETQIWVGDGVFEMVDVDWCDRG